MCLPFWLSVFGECDYISISHRAPSEGILGEVATEEARPPVKHAVDQHNHQLKDKEEAGLVLVMIAVVMKSDWSIENGLLTPTLKIKRNEIEKLKLPHYPKWYEMDGIVVWEAIE